MYQVQLVGEQQESRPLLSPSIDDFLSETRTDPPSTAALSTALDLVDLSDGGGGSSRRRSPLRRKSSSRSPRRRNRPEETELIQMEPDQPPPSPRTPERMSLDSVSLSSPLDKWDEPDPDPDLEGGGQRRPPDLEGGGQRRPPDLEGGGRPRPPDLEGGGRPRPQARCTSQHSSSELLWSAEFRTEPLVKNSPDVHSFDDLDICSSQDGASRPHRRTRSLLLRHESQEDEFVRAKAAVESDTEFWDKMQAEWEELARRNWLEEEEEPRPRPAPPPAEKGYSFSSSNPFRDCPSAFAEGQERARGGDLHAAVLLLEAAVLQDPQDAEAWQLLGTTQAENENEEAAIASLQRCLELRPNNLPALMALAVSFTNSGVQQEACEALRRWIRHHPRYRHLLDGGGPPGSPATPLRGGSTPARAQLQDVLLLFQDAALLNAGAVDPDLQTGLGVLFNLSSDFDKAVEAFSAALSVRPQDYLLWNRLGATLANGDRSQEAVEAYSRALELQPGFIRSRYNLGISCINLGAHREAVSNFLMALTQQRRSQGCPPPQMSANIWAALRIALSLLEAPQGPRPELFQAASVQDLDLLLRAFQAGDV